MSDHAHDAIVRLDVTAFDLPGFVQMMVKVGYGEDIRWAEAIVPPSDPEDFAWEIIYVICNSGMHHKVAREIYTRVKGALYVGNSAWTVFKHPGKVSAIDKIWRHRRKLLDEFLALTSDSTRLSWLGELPWIGEITKYHIAKNFGMQFAKPDVHLQRLADAFGMTPQALCEALAKRSGYKVATIDTLLWRGAAIGALNTRTAEFIKCKEET